MATLYRKYRPQNFKEVVNQNHIKLVLEHEIKSGEVAHAYLFCGPRAVGKTTLARVVAKAINCQKRKKETADPCNKCDICQEIVQGRMLDIIEIDAASHTGVDNVRENIIANARVAPSRCNYKVFIIDEVHMLSISAFNALLKIIEEPPAFVVFILCTTEVHKVPATIISRCQRFDFKKISVVDIVNKLNYIIRSEGIKAEKAVLEAIARQSDGHMRDAESILGQIISIGGKEITRQEADLVIPRSDIDEVVNLLGYLAKKDGASGVSLINKLVDEGVDLKVFTNDLIEVFRKLMLTKINPSLTQKLGLELGESMEAKIDKAGQGLSVSQIVYLIERFVRAGNELKGSFIIQLPLELAITEICSAPAVIKPLYKTGDGEQIKNQNSSQVNFSQTKPANTTKQTKGLGGREPLAAANQATKENFDKNKFLEKWNEVLAKIKQYNHSLSFILRVCQPRDIAGNQLCLAFKYKFHKDRINETSIKAIVEKVLHQVYGLPLTIEAVIDENLEVNNGGVNGHKTGPKIGLSQDASLSPAGAASQTKAASEEKEYKQGEQNKLINNLLETFGGKVVE